MLQSFIHLPSPNAPRSVLVLVLALPLFWVAAAGATVRYVDLNSPSSAPPFSTWDIAATNIQDAVNIADPGDQIVVSNGVYRIGGVAVYSSMTNRLAITKAVTVQSANGPEVTLIEGYRVPGTTNGNGAIRCVWLTNGAALIGFTLTNGATFNAGGSVDVISGGGVFGASTDCLVSNCVLAGNSAHSYGGGAYSSTLVDSTLTHNTTDSLYGGGAYCSTLNNCTLTGNLAYKGGGAYCSTLNNCTLTGNSARYGGGAFGGTLNNCTLTHNSAASFGGGTWLATLNNCALASNSAQYGGGTFWGTLSNCTLTGNWAYTSGGGGYSNVLVNCTLTGNSATNYGGGIRDSTLSNCILTGNTASRGGGAYEPILSNCTLAGNMAVDVGGAYISKLRNCVSYYNFPADRNYSSSLLDYCCTTPLPSTGAGNFTNAPQFVDQAGGDLRLQSNSPCINAGLNAYTTNSTDLDGNPRISGGTVDVGAYEFQSPASMLPYVWLLQYGLPINGSADFADPDTDGLNDWQEWVAGTNPTNAASALRLVSISNSESGTTLRWSSVTNRTYWVEGTTNPASESFSLIATNLTGLAGTLTYTNTNSSAFSTLCYRVGVAR